MRLLEAGLARQQGELARATEILRFARETALAQGAMLNAASMSRRLGEWTGDQAQIAAADAWMTAQGIAEPARMPRLMMGTI